MSTRHTPGPWKYREPDYDTFAGLAYSQRNDPKRIRIELVAIYAPGGDEVARIVHDPDDGFDLINDREMHEANARRIVDCVNACEGINPEAVPDLLEAARIALAESERANAHFGVDISPATTALRAAIAKAKTL